MSLRRRVRRATGINLPTKSLTTIAATAVLGPIAGRAAANLISGEGLSLPSLTDVASGFTGVDIDSFNDIQKIATSGDLSLATSSIISKLQQIDGIDIDGVDLSTPENISNFINDNEDKITDLSILENLEFLKEANQLFNENQTPETKKENLQKILSESGDDIIIDSTQLIEKCIDCSKIIDEETEKLPANWNLSIVDIPRLPGTLGAFTTVAGAIRGFMAGNLLPSPSNSILDRAKSWVSGVVGGAVSSAVGAAAGGILSSISENVSDVQQTINIPEPTSVSLDPATSLIQQGQSAIGSASGQLQTAIGSAAGDRGGVIGNLSDASQTGVANFAASAQASVNIFGDVDIRERVLQDSGALPDDFLSKKLSFSSSLDSKIPTTFTQKTLVNNFNNLNMFLPVESFNDLFIEPEPVSSFLYSPKQEFLSLYQEKTQNTIDDCISSSNGSIYIDDVLSPIEYTNLINFNKDKFDEETITLIDGLNYSTPNKIETFKDIAAMY